MVDFHEFDAAGFDQRAEAGGLGAGAGHHLHTLCGEAPRDGEADSLAGAGHHRVESDSTPAVAITADNVSIAQNADRFDAESPSVSRDPRSARTGNDADCPATPGLA